MLEHQHRDAIKASEATEANQDKVMWSTHLFLGLGLLSAPIHLHISTCTDAVGVLCVPLLLFGLQRAECSAQAQSVAPCCGNSGQILSTGNWSCMQPVEQQHQPHDSLIKCSAAPAACFCHAQGENALQTATTVSSHFLLRHRGWRPHSDVCIRIVRLGGCQQAPCAPLAGRVILLRLWLPPGACSLTALHLGLQLPQTLLHLHSRAGRQGQRQELSYQSGAELCCMCLPFHR